jgi:hypothetical protein
MQATQAETDDAKEYPDLDRLILSSIMLLCIGIEQSCLSAGQALKHLDGLLQVVVAGAARGCCTAGLTLSTPEELLTSILLSSRTLFSLFPANGAAAEDDNCAAMISICRSVLVLLKMLVQFQGGHNGAETSNGLQLACLAWYACQNIFAARSCGGLVDADIQNFSAMGLPDALEELIVDCCDIVAESGAIYKPVHADSLPVARHPVSALCRLQLIESHACLEQTPTN